MASSTIGCPLLADQLQAVYEGVLTCDFCPQMFDNSMDRNGHILQHFAKEICFKCGESLIRIGDQLFSLHSTLACVQSSANDLLFKDENCVQSDFVNETIDFHDFTDVQNNVIDVFEVKINSNEMIVNPNINNIIITESSVPVMTTNSISNNNNNNNNINSDTTSSTSAIVQSTSELKSPSASTDDGQHLNYSQALTEMSAIQDNHSTTLSSVVAAITVAESKSTIKNTTKIRKTNQTSVLNSQTIKCDIEGCDKEMSRNALSYHMLKHSNCRYECDICGASLSSKSGIRSHLLTHVAPNERIKCDMCELTYATKSGLRKHQKFVHSNDRSKMLICFQCGEELRQPYLLREHMNKHTGLKPFKCAYCAKHFRTKRLRQEHERIHTGEKPYRCPVDGCDRSFLYLIDLKRHKYTAHGIYTKKYPCPVCAKVFSEKMLLRKHMKSHNRIVEKKTKKSTQLKKAKT